MTDPVPSKEKLPDWLRRWYALKGELRFREAADEIERLQRELARVTGEREPPHCSTCSCGLPEPDMRALWNKAVIVQDGNRATVTFETAEEAETAFDYIHDLGSIECPTSEAAPALRPDGMPEPSLEVLKRVTARIRVNAPDTAYLAEWAVEQIEEHDQSFDLRWKADMRAIKRWQEAHPGNDLTWPDHADLCVWLLEQLDARAAQPPPDEKSYCMSPEDITENAQPDDDNAIV